MALRNRGMIVLMDASEHGEAGEFSLQLRLGDQTRGELEGKRMGVKATELPITLQALFAWAGMVREGHFTGNFAQFRDACADVQGERDDDEDVDPTRQDQSSA